MNQITAQQAQPQFTFEGGHLVMFHQEATGLPKIADANVNDRDRLIDLLAQEKYLAAGYNISILEASHEQLHQVLKQNQDTCYQAQRQLFNTAFKKGWYRLPVADAQSIFTAYNQFQQRKAEFPFPTGQQASQAQVAGQQPAVTATPADQELQQRVQQALQQASQGRVPTAATTTPSRISH